MAYVLFIIRVPFEEESKTLKTMGDGEGTSEQTDPERTLNQIQSKSHDKALQDGGDTNEINQTEDDIATALTGSLNLAKV